MSALAYIALQEGMMEGVTEVMGDEPSGLIHATLGASGISFLKLTEDEFFHAPDCFQLLVVLVVVVSCTLKNRQLVIQRRHFPLVSSVPVIKTGYT